MGITFENISYTYRDHGSLKSYSGLQGVDLDIEEGRFVAVLGVSGSGKSTLMQHFNGILLPTDGQMRILDFQYCAGEQATHIQALRKRVGLLFQFPEQQLFEETVGKDIAFGPRNFGATEEEAQAAALRVVKLLGLDPSILNLSPFQLSSGQLRKVAIATVMVTNPDIYVLDEPTASLDQVSRHGVMKLLRRLCVEEGRTIVMVSHRLEEVLPYADEFIVMGEGEIIFHGTANELMNNLPLISEAGMILPPAMRFIREFSERFQISFPEGIHRVQDIAEFVSKTLGGLHHAE
jgi:energy-coupling factor transport system ATP-binding protein